MTMQITAIDMTVLPTKLNGFPVEKSTKHLNGYHTVMVKRGADDIVVATWWPGLGDTWSWGHYETSLADAERSFKIIATRNQTRGKI
jgi:hypothetical protein